MRPRSSNHHAVVLALLVMTVLLAALAAEHGAGQGARSDSAMMLDSD